MYMNELKNMPVPTATVYTARVAQPNDRSRIYPHHTVSIGDIYNTIEQTSLRSNGSSRSSAIMQARIQSLYGNKRGHHRHRTSRDTRSLPCSSRTFTPEVLQSRPQTAREIIELLHTPRPDDPEEETGEEDGSRCVTRSEVGEYVLHNSEAGDVAYLETNIDDIYQGQPRQVMSLSKPAQYAASRGFCTRSRSALIRENESLVTSLSRQCCDVLGPKLCHECAIIKRRSRDTRRYESHLPRVEMSEQNLATTLVVAKNYPNLSMEDIEMRLARGDILKPAFKSNVQRIQNQHNQDSNKSALVLYDEPKPKLSRNPNGATYNYFTSIMDLNSKITRGQIRRRIIQSGDPYKDIYERPASGHDASETFSARQTPSFVSPRKMAGPRKSLLPACDLPLVAKVCQNVEPFFVMQDQFQDECDRADTT